jgi:type II secretory pathway component PulM
MTGRTQRALIRRAAGEHRKVLVPVGLAFLVNVVAYGVVVYPLSQRVANIAERDRSAEQALAAARLEHGQATGTLTGKARATTELATFYEDVLPHDLAGARRLTHLRLAQRAREANLSFERGSYEQVVNRGSTLTQLKISMVLSGGYPEMREFIHILETSPEFVVIDNVQLAEGADGAGSLVVTLELSTYFRGSAP